MRQSWTTKFCSGQPRFNTNIVFFPITYKKVKQFTSTEHKAPDNREAHGSLWVVRMNFLPFIILAS